MSLRRIATVACCTVFLVLAAVQYLPVAVRAGEGFQPISPEELKMTSEPLAPGAPAIILYRQVDRDDNGQTSHEDNYFRIKILTEEGRKYANIELPVVKGGYDVSRIRARTIRPDGSVAEFDGKVFEQSIVKSRGLKFLAKTFTLPDAQVGAILEYYYTYDFKEHWFYESHWILSEELFTRRARFSLKPYHHDGSKFGVRWSWQNLPPATSPRKRVRSTLSGWRRTISQPSRRKTSCPLRTN